MRLHLALFLLLSLVTARSAAAAPGAATPLAPSGDVSGTTIGVVPSAVEIQRRLG